MITKVWQLTSEKRVKRVFDLLLLVKYPLSDNPKYLIRETDQFIDIVANHPLMDENDRYAYRYDKQTNQVCMSLVDYAIVSDVCDVFCQMKPGEDKTSLFYRISDKFEAIAKSLGIKTERGCNRPDFSSVAMAVLFDPSESALKGSEFAGLLAPEK